MLFVLAGGGPLVLVGVAALLAGTTGRGVDFYLPSILIAATAGVVCLLSMLVRQRRRYQACTAVFLAKFGLPTSVMAPLYLAEQPIALGIAATLFGTPLTALCTYLCWRILRPGPGHGCRPTTLIVRASNRP